MAFTNKFVMNKCPDKVCLIEYLKNLKEKINSNKKEEAKDQNRPDDEPKAPILMAT